MLAFETLLPCAIRRVWPALLVLLSFGFFAGVPHADAQGLLGERYFGAKVGFVRFGDEAVREIDDIGLGLSATLNLPCTDNLDIQLSVGYGKLDGEIAVGSTSIDVEQSSTVLLGGPVFHFTPDQPIDPFLGVKLGVGFSEAEMRSGVFSIGEDDEGFLCSVFGGVEFDLTEQTAITPVIGYSYLNYSNSDGSDVLLAVSLNHWFTERLFGILSAEFGVDQGDLAMDAGVGFRF